MLVPMVSVGTFRPDALRPNKALAGSRHTDLLYSKVAVLTDSGCATRRTSVVPMITASICVRKKQAGACHSAPAAT